MTYCIVDRRLAMRLKRALRRYAEETGVELVAEQRGAERRGGLGRRSRSLTVPAEIDQRVVRGKDGRRVADRRATLLPVEPPAPLPRRLRNHAAGISFAERIALAAEHREDVEAARLIVRIQGGERSLFAGLYERFFERVYVYLEALVEDERTAEWLTQEAFLELHDALPTYEVLPAGFREQLATIVRRRAATHLRRTQGVDLDDPAFVEPARPECGDDAALACPDWITDGDLRVLIGRLPHAQRQTLMLRYLLGLTDSEAARVCGYGPEGVFELHDGALAYLRERLSLLGREARAASMRLSMSRGRRSGRVLRSRRFALTPG